MTTLRRELRMKLGEVCNKYLHEYSVPFIVAEKFIDELADTALEVRGIALSQQPLSIENAIAIGAPITTEIVERAQLRDLAPRMFERALGFSKPLPWWNGKEWTSFGEWVCDEYAKSKSSFGEYNIWRNTPYTKGGMANTRIRGFITEFYDSWDMFQMSKGKQANERSEPNAPRIGV